MDFLKSAKGSLLIILLTLCAVAVVFLSILYRSSGEEYESGYFYSMDALIETVGDSTVKKDVKAIFAEAEDIFDCYKESSEVSRLNEKGTLQVSFRLKNAAEEIVSLNKKYGNGADITVGALTKLWDITGKDPKIPEQNEIDTALKTTGFENINIDKNNITLKNGAQLDFGCAAKGAALDYVKETLDSKYEPEAAPKTIVSAGSSSILLYGSDKFTTRIQSPDSDDILGTLHTGPGFISTSGGYHRFTEINGKKYIHILDTKTGRPSETDLTSVTVFCQSGIDSDFLSTLIFTDGTENLGKSKNYLDRDDFKIVAVDKDKNVYVSGGLDFELTNESYKLWEAK